MAHLGTSMANLMVNSTIRTMVDGTDFGDNILAALPDVVAQAIVDGVRYGVKGGEGASNNSSRPGAIPPRDSPAGRLLTPEKQSQLEELGAKIETDKRGNITIHGPIKPQIILEILSPGEKTPISGTDGVRPVPGAEELYRIDTQDTRTPGVDWGVNIEGLADGIKYTSTYFGFAEDDGVTRAISASYEGEIYGTVIYQNGTKNAKILKGKEVINFRISEGAPLAENIYRTDIRQQNLNELAKLQSRNNWTLSPGNSSAWDGYRTNVSNLQTPTIQQIDRGHTQ
ncbi:MAG: hypothetical protein C0508_31550, partial [Cyanobacteria bacterium PR.023]|nr:hypothetical protein [Cyanobacteria bacterium PR.023]